MKKVIEKAFADFDKGVRPDGYKSPRHWYVLNSKGEAYPAKAIWALATGKRPASFNTKDARAGLTKWDYSLVDTRVSALANDFEKDVKKSIADTKEVRHANVCTVFGRGRSAMQ